MGRVLLLLVCLFVIVPPALTAQEAERLTALGHLDPAPPAAPPSPRRSATALSARSDLDAGTAAKLAGAGILGGAVGFFGGAYLGAWMSGSGNRSVDDLEFLRGMLVGATIGEGLLLPAGVHIANGSRGRYWTSALVSVGIAAAGVGLREAAHGDPPAAPAIAVAVPLAQLATSIAIERATD